MEITRWQRDELSRARKHDPRPYVRVKAVGLLALADGRSVTETARLVGVSRQSVTAWHARFRDGGIGALAVAPGRGRKPAADLDELCRYVRQSPRRFGVARTRWTLALLAETVPSLKGFSPYGVQKALARAGIGYKRAQPTVHSPDPAYAQKKGRWTAR